MFEAGGSVFESEIWADLPVVQSLFNRNNIVQTVRARLAAPAALSELKSYSDNDPRLSGAERRFQGCFQSAPRVGRAKRPATDVPDEWSSSEVDPSWTEPGLQAGWHFPSGDESNLKRIVKAGLAMSKTSLTPCSP